MAERYTIVSADCHAGGSHDQYREYLDAQYLDDFDAWRTRYDNPFRDLLSEKRTRNWDDDVRTRDLEADGIVAEVVFPNTVPPFFPTGQIVAPAPREDDFEHRLAGLRAHNRWLADFCAARPGRRAGLGQILLNDVAEAVADVQWAKPHGLAGILFPGVAPDTPWIEPLFSAAYDPLWAVCQELELPDHAPFRRQRHSELRQALGRSAHVRDGDGVLREPCACGTSRCRVSSSASRASCS